MSTLALVSLLVLAAALFGWLSARVLRIPQTLGSMGITIFASILLVVLRGVLPGLHSWALLVVGRIDLRDLILHGMLGLLLFAGAFLLDLEMLRRERLPVSLLAIFATVLSTAGVAAIMYWAAPFAGVQASWMECLLFGALISPTDPIAVLEMLQRVGVAREIEAQLAGESLFNDGIGAVLFLTVLRLIEGNTVSPGHVAWTLILDAGGALLLGIALAWCASQLMRSVDRYQVEILMTIALALGGYALAETLGVSAPLEAVAAGLAMRQFNSKHLHREIAHEDLNRFWRLIDEVQNAVLFVLLGLEVLAIAFSRETFGTGGVAILAVSIMRFASVALVMTVVRLFRPKLVTSWLALSWGGLRGGLSIALALSVPAAHGRSWILAATYVVVVFSVLIQGGTLNWVLKLRKLSP